MNAEFDLDLERRIRAALAEVMPQLEPVAARCREFDAHAGATRRRGDRGGQTVVEELEARPGREMRQPTQHRILGVAASVVALVGLGAALAFTVNRDTDAAVSPDTTPPAATAAAPIDPANGALLTTPVPAGATPMIVVDHTDWAVDSLSEFTSIAPTIASATCAGCGASRLIVAADGPLFNGPVFTTWTIDDDYNIDEFDWPTTIGTTPGRFIGSQDDSTPAAHNNVQVVWPVGAGRTAFVEAFGFTNDEVFAMAATLTFESTIPTMATPPPGFSVVATPPSAALTRQMYMNFIGRPSIVAGYDESVLELVVTDGGVQGLLDWRNPGGLFGDWGLPRYIDGVTVMVDNPHDPTEPPIRTITATWIVDGWNYTAIGHIFNTEAEFLNVIANLRLTDSATFAAATANATPTQMGTVTPNVDGTTRTINP